MMRYTNYIVQYVCRPAAARRNDPPGADQKYRREGRRSVYLPDVVVEVFQEGLYLVLVLDLAGEFEV